MKCEHDLAERETACADGMCPICLAADLNAAVEALRDLFAMLDEGLLIRDISKDHEPDYHVRAIAFTQRLSNNYAALAKIGGT